MHMRRWLSDLPVKRKLSKQFVKAGGSPHRREDRARKWYPFWKAHKGKFFTAKDADPVFAEDSERIVVATV